MPSVIIVGYVWQILGRVFFCPLVPPPPPPLYPWTPLKRPCYIRLMIVIEIGSLHLVLQIVFSKNLVTFLRKHPRYSVRSYSWTLDIAELLNYHDLNHIRYKTVCLEVLGNRPSLSSFCISPQRHSWKERDTMLSYFFFLLPKSTLSDAVTVDVLTKFTG